MPAALKTCATDPVPPDRKTATQRDTAIYTPKLWGAWKDCSSTVKAQNDFLEQAKKEIAK